MLIFCVINNFLDRQGYSQAFLICCFRSLNFFIYSIFICYFIIHNKVPSHYNVMYCCDINYDNTVSEIKRIYKESRGIGRQHRDTLYSITIG